MNALINHTFRHSSKTRQDGGQPRSARSRKPRFSASTPERPTGRGAEGYTIKAGGSALAASLGGIIAIWGRVRASRQIGKGE